MDGTNLSDNEGMALLFRFPPEPDRHDKFVRRFISLAGMCTLCLLLVGCAWDDSVPLDVVGYNHTDHEIGQFLVNNGVGDTLGPHEGGGGFVCCIAVPGDYKPGMTVTVRWGRLDIDQFQERVVPVPPYGPHDFGAFAVHFLRDGQVKVFVTRYSLGHPDYPLKGEEARL